MKTLKINIIFHRTLTDMCYRNLSNCDLSKINFIAVNPSIPKTFDSKYSVLNEWELPFYEKSLQENNFRENTVLYHLYKNNFLKTDYVGFLQYDMTLNPNFFNCVEEQLHKTPECILSVMLENCNQSLVLTSPNYPREFVLNSYNAFFNKNKTMGDMNEAQYPLLNSYIIPLEMYNRLGAWLESIMLDIYKIAPEHIAGYLERVTAIFLALEDAPKISIANLITHEPSIRK